MKYAAIIKYIRDSLFLTQVELAEKLNVSFETINRWENGKFIPSMKQRKNIKNFCDANNITLEKNNEHEHSNKSI